MLVSEANVEKAFDHLRDSAPELAEWVAQVTYLENYSKALKAILMKESGEKSAAAQEREAYAHPKYQAHLEELKQAVFERERLRGLAKAAEMKLEVWRTECANQRRNPI
tara:strand:+ start:408 stop:734 length:327 start_codon:yes stop_codon:yes gene_type:complete